MVTRYVWPLAQAARPSATIDRIPIRIVITIPCCTILDTILNIRRMLHSGEPAAGMEAIIEARKVEKSYGSEGKGSVQVIAPTDLAIYPGEIMAVLGPSGSGKSTLLRMLTGLAKPSGGEIIHHGHQVGGPCENVSIVFQSFALFPWLTVLENVAAPLKARGVPAAERTQRSVRILDTVGLDGFENAYPTELPGGVKERG